MLSSIKTFLPLFQVSMGIALILFAGACTEEKLRSGQAAERPADQPDGLPGFLVEEEVEVAYEKGISIKIEESRVVVAPKSFSSDVKLKIKVLENSEATEEYLGVELGAAHGNVVSIAVVDPESGEPLMRRELLKPILVQQTIAAAAADNLNSILVEKPFTEEHEFYSIGKDDLSVGDSPSLALLDPEKTTVYFSVEMTQALFVVGDFEASFPNFNSSHKINISNAFQDAKADVADAGGSTLDAGDNGVPAWQLAYSVGQVHNCLAITPDKVKCWGTNFRGALGWPAEQNIGDDPGELKAATPLAVKEGGGIKSIVSGSYHSCILYNEGFVRCWGMNSRGQLGWAVGYPSDHGDDSGETIESLPPVDLGSDFQVAKIYARNLFTCALSNHGKVKCWGDNFSGQLGQGHQNNLGATSPDSGSDLKNLNPIEIGFSAVELALSHGAVCALSGAGKVKCWGDNWSGQLGIGNTEDIGDEPNEMGPKLKYIDFGDSKKVTALAAGWEFHCFIFEDGTAKCIGRNDTGQLGQGGSGIAKLNLEGIKNLKPIPLGGKVKSIAAGPQFACAVLEGNGVVKCWGVNRSGSTGFGDRGGGEDDYALEPVTLPLPKIATMHANYTHICGWFADEKFRCWGMNHNGVLGLGDKETRGDDPGEIANLPAIDF